MPTLYVTQPGAQVRKVDERLVVVKEDEILEDIPLIKVERVVLVGRGVALTTAAIHALSRRRIDVLYLTGTGRFVSRVVGAEHKNIQLRFLQALFVADESKALAAAASIVQGKVTNQRALVRRHTESSPGAQQALDEIDAMRRQVGQASTLDVLRGMEGQAAQAYFHLLRGLLRPPLDGSDWGFHQRAYYPPPDPINALLSFGYTLLLNDIVAACQTIGLDPYLGVFHAIDYGRPSMALDLEEEFRPIIVDSIVLQVINQRGMRLRDFETAGNVAEDEDEPPSSGAGRKPSRKGGIYLNEAGRSRFIELYETRVNDLALYPPTNEQTNYRRIFALQAQAMARLILGEVGQYQPYTVR